MKIICIGRNYSDHARELNNEVSSDPLFFLKPESSVLHKRHAFYIPEWTSDVHYEAELVVKIVKRGKAVLKNLSYNSIMIFCLPSALSMPSARIFTDS